MCPSIVAYPCTDRDVKSDKKTEGERMLAASRVFVRSVEEEGA